MANIMARKNKDGEITSYYIRVYKGRDSEGKQLKPYLKTWKPNPNMSERQIKKEVEKIAILFEKECKEGMLSGDEQFLRDYLDYIIKLKQRIGIKQSTIDRYKSMTFRINGFMGHIKLSAIRPSHINNFYEYLSREGIRKNTEKATLKADINLILKEKNISTRDFSRLCGVSENTLYLLLKGNKKVSFKTAKAISEQLDRSIISLFEIEKDNTPLSNATILEYHRFLSTSFAQAEKEGLIINSPVKRSTPPKYKRKEAEYYSVEDLKKILECLEKEPLKWRILVHLLIVTGARRGEIAGLKWENVNLEKNEIHICNNLLYSPEIGIYEDSTKTPFSDRYIKLPEETMVILRKYKEELGETTRGLIFLQENGNPIQPDSITNYLGRFSVKYGLNHIKPHSFRHTMASILYYNGIDSVSISRRLGHAKVSTTSDIYAHLMQKADTRSAECIANTIYYDEQ